MYGVARRDLNRCVFCGACRNQVACPAGEVFTSHCIGCGACVLACAGGAVQIVEDKSARQNISIVVDGARFSIPERISLKAAFELTGFSRENLWAPCGVGGCFCCAVLVDGHPKPACITGVKEGMVIDTRTEIEPLRVVTGFGPHTVGGVGTPIDIRTYASPIEVACFTHGCNFRCPQCQNHIMSFSGGFAMQPRNAAVIMSNMRRIYRVHRMTFSGGECTLNRRWLIQAIQELKKMNPDERARIHVDTNGSLLTRDYLDALVSSGMTDIGIDLKGLKVETFQRITGIDDVDRAARYRDRAWNALTDICENYPEVFVGVGIPYQKDLISREEIQAMGERIAAISDSVQVCALDYRPAFRMRMDPPTFEEMKHVKEILNGTGLKTVIAQTPRGHIGP